MSRPRFDAPVVALDIDGTLGDYHGHFIRFAEQYLGRSLPDPYAVTGGIPLYKYLHISHSMYRQIKLAYRQGGMKRSMPVYENASNLSRMIRRNGCQVWICTTRPYLRLDNIDPDTRHWLRRHKIQYDAVLFGEHKYRDLKKAVGDRVLFVVDDLPPMLEQASESGMTTVLRRQPYNDGWYYSANHIASDLEEVMEVFRKEFTNYVESQPRVR
jgi:hypothetical protein